MSLDSLKRRIDRLDERGGGAMQVLPGTVKLDIEGMSPEERERLRAVLLAAKAKEIERDEQWRIHEPVSGEAGRFGKSTRNGARN
jgi:hypothetical protein